MLAIPAPVTVWKSDIAVSVRWQERDPAGNLVPRHEVLTGINWNDTSQKLDALINDIYETANLYDVNAVDTDA